MSVGLRHNPHLWLAVQLRRPGRIKRCRELDDDGLRAHKGTYGFYMEALRMLRFEPPPPDRRTDGYSKISRQGIKVGRSFGTHTTSILL